MPRPPAAKSIRTMLRLEHLFDRLGQLLPRDTAIDHHFALVTVFEIMDVAARADLKADVLKELERHRGVLQGYRGNPQISEAALDEIVTRIDRAFDSLNQLAGKAGAALTSNEWLMSVRSRINIPGGTCEFDLPGYYAWQQHPPESRRHDLVRWTASLTPLAEALQVLLGLLRDSGTPQRVVAAGGHFQQSLPSAGDALVPEISGHRLLAMVRFMQQDGDGRLKPSQHNTEFELTLCS